ncbi:MAG: sulfotransferase [Xanthomonadales bacterium]|nr:sulfotransferase [Xanthomonadales bacterium]
MGSQSDSRHQVPGGLYWKTRLVTGTRPFWAWLGRLESRILRDEIEATAITQPIYVTALARSGTTIVTELLHAHPATTAHHYADFPLVDIPFWRNWLHARTRVAVPQAVERAHGDRILVTEDSPEAVEELLWMAAFPRLHDPRTSQLLGPEQRNVAFDSVYRDHIRKLLLVRGAQRYVAKGNYNISRLRYLLDLFPDARFIVPVRHPVNHIASLAKQHRFFSAGQEHNPRIRLQLAASGHFEFGQDRRAVHLGDEERARAIREAWSQGQDIRGWALYWESVYSYLWALRTEDPRVADALLFVRFEDLCRDGETWIDRIFEHAGLEPHAPTRAEFAGRLSPPDYYQPDFSSAEMELIETITGATAARYGY